MKLRNKKTGAIYSIEDIELELEIARLKGQNEVLRQINPQLKGGKE